MDDGLITRFVSQVNQIIDHKISGLTRIESAVVESVNVNGTVNLFIPPDSTIYHNVQNQSIFQNLQPGDCVKIIKENNDLSNIWIIGCFSSQSNIIVNKPEIDDLQRYTKVLNDDIYQLQQNLPFYVVEPDDPQDLPDLNEIDLNTGIGKIYMANYFIKTDPSSVQESKHFPTVTWSSSKPFPGMLSCSGMQNANDKRYCYYIQKYIVAPSWVRSEDSQDYVVDNGPYLYCYMRWGENNPTLSTVHWTPWKRFYN